MKKFLLIILSIITIAIGVGCDESSKKENEPIFPNEMTDVVYADIKYGDVSYTIKKEDMFISMRNTVGLAMLVEWADEMILTTTGKRGLYEILTGSEFENLDNTPYFEQVTEKEVMERLESEKYPNGASNYTDLEKEELENTFIQKFYNYGYRTTEEIKKYYKLEIAKEKLAKDYQEMYRSSSDFGNSDYQDYWKKNYYDSYYMILVPFDSQLALKNTFKELNIKIDDSDKKNIKFVKNDTSVELTENEIIEAYIKLYNNSNLFKTSVNEANKLTEGKEYSIFDGKYKVNKNEENVLLYSKELVKLIHSDLRSLIANLTPYDEIDSENKSYYIPYTTEINSSYYTVLLLSKDDKKPYEEAKSEIKDKLLENEFISDYIDEIMAKLRIKFDLVIYDKILQNGYINKYYPGNGFYDGSFNNGDILVAFKESTLTKDEFFDIMDKRFGAYTLGELINYYNVLYDKALNTIYDLTKVGTEEDRILNKYEWRNILVDVELEKDYFEAGKYGYLGYTIGYGFENFLQAVYDIRTEKELAFNYLRKIVWGEYLVKKYSLANYDENSLMWKNYQKLMQEEADKYFKANGFDFELTYLDENGNYANPSTWSDEQTALVKEFYGLLVEFFDNNKNVYKEAADLMVLKYQEAPYLIGENTSGEIFNGMDLSKYKTAGIILIYEDLGAFDNEDLNEALSSAAKELWDKNPSSEEPEVYGIDENGYKFIISETGYHVYFKIKNIDMTRFGERNIPSLEEIKTYIKDNDTDDLTDEQKNAIEVYYGDIYRDVIDVYNAALLLYTEQGNCSVELKTNNYTYDIYQKTLSITKLETKENVKYVVD